MRAKKSTSSSREAITSGPFEKEIAWARSGTNGLRDGPVAKAPSGRMTATRDGQSPGASSIAAPTIPNSMAAIFLPTIPQAIFGLSTTPGPR